MCVCFSSNSVIDSTQWASFSHYILTSSNSNEKTEFPLFTFTFTFQLYTNAAELVTPWRQQLPSFTLLLQLESPPRHQYRQDVPRFFFSFYLFFLCFYYYLLTSWYTLYTMTKQNLWDVSLTYPLFFSQLTSTYFSSQNTKKSSPVWLWLWWSQPQLVLIYDLFASQWIILDFIMMQQQKEETNKTQTLTDTHQASSQTLSFNYSDVLNVYSVLLLSSFLSLDLEKRQMMKIWVNFFDFTLQKKLTHIWPLTDRQTDRQADSKKKL